MIPRVTAWSRSSARLWAVWRQRAGGSAVVPATRLTPAQTRLAAGDEFAPPSGVMHRFPASPMIVCGMALSRNAPASTSLVRIAASPLKMNAVHLGAEVTVYGQRSLDKGCATRRPTQRPAADPRQI